MTFLFCCQLALTGNMRFKDINLELNAGETVCVVGESGSGKSLTARAVMGLLPAPHVRVGKGEIIFAGEDLTKGHL
jgi:peptide/nickel transport system ATP-binding protein